MSDPSRRRRNHVATRGSGRFRGGRRGRRRRADGPRGLAPSARAPDEACWAQVAVLCDVARDPAPLANGDWGVMAKPVQAACLRHTERVDREGSAFARRAPWWGIVGRWTGAAASI